MRVAFDSLVVTVIVVVLIGFAGFPDCGKPLGQDLVP